MSEVKFHNSPVKEFVLYEKPHRPWRATGRLIDEVMESFERGGPVTLGPDTWTFNVTFYWHDTVRFAVPLFYISDEMLEANFEKVQPWVERVCELLNSPPEG